MTKPLYEESDPEIFSQCNVLPFYVASTRIYVTKYKLLFFFFFWPSGMWDLSSPTKDGTHTPALEAWSLNRSSTREVPTTIS